MFAIVFPGQGSQEVGMAADFARQSPEARAVLDEADEAFGDSLSRWIVEGPVERLRQTEITQPAVLAASLAIYRALEPRLKGRPALLAGHSLGEYTALVAAGALALSDAVRLVRRRGALMQEAVAPGLGAMVAVLGIDAEVVEEVCAATPGCVSPANYNAPGQTVVAGEAEAVAAVGRELRERGARRLMPLDVSAPFHCELMAPAQKRLAPILAETPFGDARTPVISNVDAQPYQKAEDARERLRAQVCAPVRWVECVRTLTREGVGLQLEVGPGRVLSGLAARIERGLARAHVREVADLQAAVDAAAEAA